MSKVLAQPGKIVVSSIVLSSFDGSKPTKEIKKLCASVDIWEDIRKPAIIVDIFVSDAIGLVTGYPIVGEERITITLGYPNADPTTLNLVVVGVGDFIYDESGKGSGVMLNCTSEEVWLDSLLSVMKGYNTTVDGIVRDLVTSQLKSKKTLDIEPTKGISQFVIPRLTPFETIDILRKRAVSTTSAGSQYMFFETKKGYVFKTIEKMFKDGSALIASKNRVFVRGNMTISNTKSGVDNTHLFRSIISMQSNRRADSAGKIFDGALNNITYAFDFARKQIKTLNFSLQQKGSSFVLGDTTGKIPASTPFLQKYGSTNAVAFLVPFDSTKGETFIPETLGAKVSYEALINQQNVIVETYGDFDMSAGDAVKLSIPQQQGTTDNIQKEDPHLSGTYIIMALRHMIIMGPNDGSEYTMSMELLKGNMQA